MEELEQDKWYQVGESKYIMVDSMTDGTWVVISKREEDQSSLNDLINFHLTAKTIERPEKNCQNMLVRP